jgi:ATP-dependent DNA helicase DinG
LTQNRKFNKDLGVVPPENRYTASMDIDALCEKLKRHGLQDRSSQRQMIEAVYSALEKNKILCIEAPTGTGKTLSYGIASLEAHKAKQHIVISTATIALQEQLISKDLPLLTKLTDKEFKYALAKGRRRYVCHARLYDQQIQVELLDEDKHLEELQSLLENKKWRGDRDELKTYVPDSTWQQISTDASGCSGKRCAFYEDCAFYRARRKMHAADIIVANHSLLLSDLELGGGAILPDMETCVYIIDECHHLAQKALSHFAKMAGILNTVEWINQFTKALSKAEQLGEVDKSLPETVKPLTHNLVQQLKTLNDYLEDHDNRFVEDIWRPTENELSAIRELANEIKTASRQVYSHCYALQQEMEAKITHNEKIKKEPNEELNRLFININFVTGRAKNLYDTWMKFCHERKKNEAPIARWFSKGKNYHCHAAPINVSKELEDYFWDKVENGVILCSATVRSLGNFNDFHRRSGLTDDKRVIDVAIDPFFDYSQSILYIPTMQHAPQGKDQEAHHQEVLGLLPQLIPAEAGSLVLFASIRAMELTYDDLPDEIIDDVLMQNQYSKRRIIELHKDNIRKGQRSILFGLASFGEGLDLPADFCQHVIIHKLPFSVPTTPLEVTRNEWLKSNNKNPFMLATLPETSLRLTQYIGRLIRQETDKGIVTILDKRLYSRQYGSSLLKGLPGFRRLINKPIDELLPLMPDLYDTAEATPETSGN